MNTVKRIEKIGGAPKPKTWERTDSWPKGLLRHKSGNYYLRTFAKGKTLFTPLKTDVLEVAKARAVEERKDVESIRRSASRAERGIATMGDLRQLFLERLEAGEIGDGIKEKSKELMRDSIRYIGKTWPDGEEAFWNKPPRSVTVDTVKAWRAHSSMTGTGHVPPGAKKVSQKVAGRSPRSYNKALYALRSLLNLAVDTGAIAGNPLVARRKGELTRRDTPRRPVLPEREKLNAMLDEVSRLGGRTIGAAELLRALYLTGMRIGEAGRLCWKHVRLDRMELDVPGTKTAAALRSLPLSEAALEHFRRIRARRQEHSLPCEGDAPVFILREAQKSMDRACAAVGIARLTPHDLRDAFATVVIESGVDIPTLARWLGHADGGALAMKVYGHLRRDHSVAQMEKVRF